MKKHIVCLGDSNTHGYCAEPFDCADGGIRFNEEERWTCLLQQKLGADALVLEEGLSGRTTVFSDPVNDAVLDAISVVDAILLTHEPVDLLIIMLGTNDTKERFSANAGAIARGMERLVRKCARTECWAGGKPNILVVCPPPMGEGFQDPIMGEGCREKSLALPPLMKAAAERAGAHFFDAAACEMNGTDHMHLSRRGHAQLADALAGLVSELIG